MIVEFDCIVCGRHMRKRRSPANTPKPPRFCSHKCQAADRSAHAVGVLANFTFTCLVCSKEVCTYRGAVALAARPPRYCSLQCTGLARRAEANPSWAGGRHQLNTGYIVISAPEHPNADVRGYMLEHRLVMERSLGRYLSAEEVVHHLNHVKTDNRPENLAVISSHTEHAKLHAAERKAGTAV